MHARAPEVTWSLGASSQAHTYWLQYHDTRMSHHDLPGHDDKEFYSLPFLGACVRGRECVAVPVCVRECARRGRRGGGIR